MGEDSQADLDTISANHSGDVIRCCSSLFSLWLQRQPEANWQQLIDALIKVKLNLLASEIKESLILSEEQQSLQQDSLKGIYVATYCVVYNIWDRFSSWYFFINCNATVIQCSLVNASEFMPTFSI